MDVAPRPDKLGLGPEIKVAFQLSNVLTTRKLFRAVVAACLILVTMASAAGADAHVRHGRARPDRRGPVVGIDVSHYQGSIDWAAVASHGVSFAYIKATEGVQGRDARFARNWQDARRTGIRVGAYHYFIFCRSGRAQAQNFLTVAPRSAGTLPPAVDLEAWSSCHRRPTGGEMRRELDAYLAVVERRERRRAVLYVTPGFYAAYRAYLPRRPMWRRSILERPPANESWAFWQYRSRGRVAGIQTRVDLNIDASAHPRRVR
jgi:lysozyme